MNISIDVVTICLNSNSSIKKCLDSVRNNRAYINDFIVIDGKSIDGTLETLNNNKDIISTLVSEPDFGISDAFNKGIRCCSGDFILLLNADDWLIDGAVRNVLRSISKNDDIICTVMTAYEGNNIVGLFHSSPELISRFNSMLHPGALIKRSVYKELGGYDDQLKVAMDYDYFCRCYLAGLKFRCINLPLVNFTIGGASHRYKYKIFSESFKLRKKYFNANFPMLEIRQICKRWIGDSLHFFGLKKFIKNILKENYGTR